jgi:hypothetical protein
MRLYPATLLALLLSLTTALDIPWFTLTQCKPGNPGSVYYCSNPNFTGDCAYRLANDDCFVPSGGSMNGTPMSIGPDKGGYCVMFEDRECKGSIIHYDERNKGVK